MNQRTNESASVCPYDPAAVNSADLVALAPYLTDHPDEALVLLGSRNGRPCGITVTPLAGLSRHPHPAAAGLAWQWGLQEPTHLTAIVHARWAGDAFGIDEGVFGNEFMDTVGIGFERFRRLWVYGDGRWTQGSLLYDDIRLRPAKATDPALARMWALGLHAYTEPEAPRAPLPDFRAIADGSHLAEQELDELVWHVAPGGLPDEIVWGSLADRLDAEPTVLAAAIDHILAGEVEGGEPCWSALAYDSEHHRANATTKALAQLADWRWGREPDPANRPGRRQRFARHVRHLLASGTTPETVGLHVTGRF